MVYNNVTEKKCLLLWFLKGRAGCFSLLCEQIYFIFLFLFFFILRFLFSFMALNEVNKLVPINTPALSNYFIAQKSVLTVLVLTF